MQHSIYKIDNSRVKLTSYGTSSHSAHPELGVNAISKLIVLLDNALKYALSKIVIPYDELKFHYPILQKHRWLTPIMQIRRWFKLIFCGHARRSMRELSYNRNISKSQADEMKTFLDEIGL